MYDVYEMRYGPVVAFLFFFTHYFFSVRCSTTHSTMRATSPTAPPRARPRAIPCVHATRCFFSVRCSTHAQHDSGLPTVPRHLPPVRVSFPASMRRDAMRGTRGGLASSCHRIVLLYNIMRAP